MHPLKKYITICLLACCVVVQQYGKAQGVINYPVGVTPVIYPPYPFSLQYIGNANQPFMYVTLTNKSSNAGLLNVLLKVKITTGTFVAQTSSVSAALPVSLMGNTPVRLSNLDMASLFSYGNLSGITLDQYNNTFPQSTIKYSFTLYDAITQRQISEESSYSLTFTMNAPPITTMPADKSLQTAQGAQNIFFQWQPKQGTSAGGVLYVLQVVQLLYEGQDPQSAFLTNPIYYTDSTITTTYNYNGSKTPPLLSNRTYAWRVQAKSNDNGGFMATVFSNNGYSNVASFKYSSPCQAVALFMGDLGSNKATISWLSFDSDPLTLQLSYKKESDADWTPIRMSAITGDNFTIPNLKSSTKYQIKAIRTCVAATSFASSVTATSNITRFTTNDANGLPASISPDNTSTTANANAIKASCGAKPVYTRLDESNLLATLVENDIIKAGDFSITVSSATGGGGTFSGSGIIEMWLGGHVFKTDVRFSSIKINKNKEVIDGAVNLSNQ